MFHEIGHIVNGDYGISFEKEGGDKEDVVDRYAADKLIPSDKYKEFVSDKVFSEDSIRDFADSIDRDPGIVLGRLQKDGLVRYDDGELTGLRHKYKVTIKC